MKSTVIIKAYVEEGGHCTPESLFSKALYPLYDLDRRITQPLIRNFLWIISIIFVITDIIGNLIIQAVDLFIRKYKENIFWLFQYPFVVIERVIEQL